MFAGECATGGLHDHEINKPKSIEVAAGQVARDITNV